MAFITGSITNANPGPTLYALIETAALGIGWTLDDTVVIGGNTHKVLKSAAAGNTYGLDWFLDINYPTTGITGGMRFAPFEGYTAASDVGLRGPFGGTNNTVVDATTYSRYGATTSALETNWANTASFSAMGATLATTAFTYWVSITRNRITMITSIQPTAVFYTGFFTPTAQHSSWAGASLFPLIMVRMLANSNASGSTTPGGIDAAITRAPKATNGVYNWSTGLNISGSPAVLSWTFSGTVGTGASDHSGVTSIMPLPVYFGSTSAGANAHVGYLDGLAAAPVIGTAVRGDTITVGSDTWYSTTATGASPAVALFMAGV